MDQSAHLDKSVNEQFHSSSDIIQRLKLQLEQVISLDYNQRWNDDQNQEHTGCPDIYTPLVSSLSQLGFSNNEKLARPVYWHAIQNIVIASPGGGWNWRNLARARYEEDEGRFAGFEAVTVYQKYKLYLLSNLFGIKFKPDLLDFMERTEWRFMEKSDWK